MEGHSTHASSLWGPDAHKTVENIRTLNGCPPATIAQLARVRHLRLVVFFILYSLPGSQELLAVAVRVAVGRPGHGFPPTLVPATQRESVMTHSLSPLTLLPGLPLLRNKPRKMWLELEEVLFPFFPFILHPEGWGAGAGY